MPRPLLPPRGIFIPTHMIFNTQIPPAVLVTWIQLRCLAWRGWVTSPLSISELASLLGIHPARLHRHLFQLHEISALSWRSAGNEKIIVVFPEEPSVEAKNQAGNPAFLNSPDKESPALASYFPRQILGYLSYQEDQEGFYDQIDHGDPEDLEYLEQEGAQGFPSTIQQAGQPAELNASLRHNSSRYTAVDWV